MQPSTEARCSPESESQLVVNVQFRIAACIALLLPGLVARAQPPILVEVESFDELGGWLVDQQFMDLMGSPYLLAQVWESRLTTRPAK